MVQSAADRFALVWLATLAAVLTTYLGVSGVLSSDAVAGLLGSVISLASGFTIRNASAKRESDMRERFASLPSTKGGDHARDETQ